MKSDILAGQWKQLRGEIRKQWGKLTDDDLDRIKGSSEKLIGLLQEKYGYSKVKARQKVDELRARFGPGTGEPVERPVPVPPHEPF